MCNVGFYNRYRSGNMNSAHNNKLICKHDFESGIYLSIYIISIRDITMQLHYLNIILHIIKNILALAVLILTEWTNNVNTCNITFY